MTTDDAGAQRTPSPPAAVEPRPVARDVSDVACIQCGYDLSGLKTDWDCPECGEPVARSLRGDKLVYAGSGYLRRLHWGSIALLTFLVLQLLAAIAIVFVVMVLAASAPAIVPFLVPLSVTFGMAATLLSVVGWWLFTTPDPNIVRKERDISARRVARFLAVMTAGSSMLQTVINLIAPEILAFMEEGFDPIGLALLGLWLWGFFAGLLYMGQLGKRTFDRRIHERARRALWLLPLLTTVGILIIVGPLIAYVLYYRLINQLRIEFRTARRHGT